MKERLITASMVLVLSVSFLFSGCDSPTPEEEGFAIYLTRDNIPVEKMEALSHIEIAEEPIISGDDVISYDWKTHEIEITAAAFDRIKQGKKSVPGESFIVCVNRQPVYWGAFWSLLSSQSFDGITIMRPFNTNTEGGYFINITRGYPSEGFYQGEDPRSSQSIKEALEKAGKLE